jgi:(p)ppGpp synthase/HD superfamily hydrolase
MLTPRYNEALEYTAWLHRNQIRKGTEIPYISHLVAVSMIALEYGANEDEAIAALLHDAVEDQGGLPALVAIREKFGEPVAAIVEGCTDSTADTSKGETKLPWKERKLVYIAHIAEASPSVRLVSTADKLHNAMSILKDYQAIGETLWERFKGGKEGTLWYYRSLVTVFEESGSTSLVEKLDQVVTALEELVKDRALQSTPTESFP